VDDVEPASTEREQEVCAHADGDAEVRAPRDRDGRPDRDHLPFEPSLERASAVEEVPSPGRGSEHRDLVPELPERLGGALHVRVHLVRLRPRERRDEADAEAHPGQGTTCNFVG